MAPQRDRIELVCALLALVVAGIHLYWGLPRFAVYATVGTMADPRPLAFVLTGHAIAGGVSLAALGVLDPRRLYRPGIALMVVHLGAYAAWHTVLSHGVGGETHHEQLTPFAAIHVVLEHVVNSPLALASKTTEAAVLVLLGWLLLAEWRGGRSA